VISIDHDRRKDVEARRVCLNSVDAVILCLPDQAARDAVALIENPDVRVIDASTAHRVDATWDYGFPELAPGQRDSIRRSRRVSNPGCYPTGFLALIRPLVDRGLIPADWPLSVNAVSGYSGGGKPMIAEFEDQTSDGYTHTAYRPYALSLSHKHVPEMTKYAGLTHKPLFAPAVGRFRQGMIVEAPLHLTALPGRPSVSDIHEALKAAYQDEPFIEVVGLDIVETTTVLDPESLNGTNRLALWVFHDAASEQVRLAAILDNLGKGASGAAVQNLNLMLGLNEAAGL
jgi:N-acetyl-gamma-glutamyl-phosphate reductase